MSSSEIKILRLSTGEELITTVIKTENTSTRGTLYHLTDTAILIPTEANQLGLAPFMAYSTAMRDGFTIAEKDIMFLVDPVDDLKTQYQNMFSKIMTPNSQVITSG